MLKKNTEENLSGEGKDEEQYILVYLLRVDEGYGQYQGYLTEVEDLSEAWHRYVDDFIEVVSLTEEIDLICGEDAVVQGRPLNRAWYDADGGLITVFAGNLMLVRHKGRHFTNMRKEDVQFVEKRMKPIDRIAYGIVFTKPEDSLPEWDGHC